jgi:2C-methyl-D-erythritol 2,4-cyclodiphosphate synthase
LGGLKMDHPEGLAGHSDGDVLLHAVTDALLRLGAMVEAHAQIAELDANPLLAGPDGALIVDARVRVRPAQAIRPLGALRN